MIAEECLSHFSGTEENQVRVYLDLLNEHEKG